MPLFKRKPIVEEAIRYEAGKAYEVEAFMGKELPRSEHGSLQITTVAGIAQTEPGDYIVKHIGGELSVWSPKAFEDQYEPAGRKKKST